MFRRLGIVGRRARCSWRLLVFFGSARVSAGCAGSRGRLRARRESVFPSCSALRLAMLQQPPRKELRREAAKLNAYGVLLWNIDERKA